MNCLRNLKTFDINNDSESNLETLDNTKNRNSPSVKHGNVFIGDQTEKEDNMNHANSARTDTKMINGNNPSVKNGNMLNCDSTGNEDGMKNANDIIIDMKNRNMPINSLPETTIKHVDSHIVDDSDDDTVIYTSEPECDQFENVNTNSRTSETTPFDKPRLSKQVSISLRRLTDEEISTWLPKDRPDIDNPLLPQETADESYSVRDRNKPKEHPAATARKSSRNKNKKEHEQGEWYDDPDIDIPPSPKRKKRVYIGLKGPSLARIRSQHRITEPPKQRIPVDYLSPSSDAEKDAKQPTNTNADTTGHTIVKTVPGTTLDTLVKPAKTGTNHPIPAPPKGKFSNCTHGIVLRKRIRTYKCNVCGTASSTQSEANAHFKNNHPPVQCSKCTKTCSTPSTLSRHMYLHGNLKYPCHRCDQRFAFESELKVHKYKHRRLKMFKCSGSNCKKSYFSENELQQHAKIHDNIQHQCDADGCNYSNTDICLLRSHERLHRNFFRFFCCTCTRGFKYHTQWKRHVTAISCTVPPLQT